MWQTDAKRDANDDKQFKIKHVKSEVEFQYGGRLFSEPEVVLS